MAVLCLAYYHLLHHTQALRSAHILLFIYSPYMASHAQLTTSAFGIYTCDTVNDRLPIQAVLALLTVHMPIDIVPSDDYYFRVFGI